MPADELLELLPAPPLVDDVLEPVERLWRGSSTAIEVQAVKPRTAARRSGLVAMAGS